MRLPSFMEFILERNEGLRTGSTECERFAMTGEKKKVKNKRIKLGLMNDLLTGKNGGLV